MMNAASPLSNRRPFHHTLAFRVGATGVLLMVLMLIVFAMVFVVSERREERADILEGGKSFASLAAEPIYNNYTEYYAGSRPERFSQFRDRLNRELELNEDIRQVTLLATDGRILFDSKELTDGKYSGPKRTLIDEATLAAVRSRKMSTRDITVENTSHIEIVAPIMEEGSEPLAVRYILSYDTMHLRMAEVYQRIAIVALILLTFVAGLMTFYVTRLTRPILQLTRVAEQIRAGNLAARVTMTRKDEVGQLGQTLNDMAAQLRSYYDTLEARVRERTKELQATQTQLLENVKQDEALLASIGDGVIATDQSGHIIWMNKPAEDMLKIGKEQVLGKPYDTVWHLETDKGSTIKEEDQPLYQAFKTGQSVRNSAYSYVRKDEQGDIVVKFAVAVTVAPVLLNNQIIGIINVFRDITHERQVDRMKTEFISLASHQLRTPLSAIRWFTEMLLSGDAGELTAEQKDFAQNVYESVDRMIELVNSLLNISRIESGRIIVDPKPTDLNQLVGGVVNDLKAKTEQKQQTLIVSVHKDLPKVNLDPRLIGQVYMNFLTNAIKYTPKGGEISVFVSRKGEELVSQITDNGYGIPKSQHERVFQKFFRAENIVKVETDGTGLGLYLVKAIIESSGGRVWFKSEEGKGTTFWFTIPMSGMKAKEGEVTLDA